MSVAKPLMSEASQPSARSGIEGPQGPEILVIYNTKENAKDVKEINI